MTAFFYRQWRASWVAAFALCAAAATAADLQFDRSLFRNPPTVSQASFEVLNRPGASGNSIIRVQFADKRRNTLIAIRNGRDMAALRDDGQFPDTTMGDGVYAAIVSINLQQHFREQQRRVALARRAPRLPLFAMRQLIGWEAFKPSPARLPQPGDRIPVDRFFGVPIDISPAKELLITDPAVVDDPMRTFDACTGVGTPLGAWTFGRLMTEIANEDETGIRPGDLVEHWISQWSTDLTINSFTVFNRQVGAQLLLDQWPRLPDGQLDLAQAPFRLLAIVNRLDLRESAVYGGSGGGEARLVFGAINCNDAFTATSIQPGMDDALAFTVIFEYAVPSSSCPQVRNWAQQWTALGALNLGSAAYNTQLQSITDQFTLRGAQPTRLPNKSALNQLRTNEFALSVSGEAFWELREARLVLCGLLCTSNAGLLEHATVAQTPDITYQASVTGRSLTRDYINANELAILVGAHQVPLVLPTGERFRGGAIAPGAGFAWNPGIVDPEARHQFSKATCSGCHTRETDADFLHIFPRNAGVAAQLSDFLTGNNMPKSDPVSGESRAFDELLDRQQKLDAAANMTCITAADFAVEELFFKFVPSAFAH